MFISFKQTQINLVGGMFNMSVLLEKCKYTVGQNKEGTTI